MKAVRRVTHTRRALSFTQGIVTEGTISWRTDAQLLRPEEVRPRHRWLRRPLTLATSSATAATPPTIRHAIRLDARARAALKRHPRARFVLHTTLRLPKGRVLPTPVKAVSEADQRNALKPRRRAAETVPPSLTAMTETSTAVQAGAW